MVTSVEAKNQDRTQFSEDVLFKIINHINYPVFIHDDQYQVIYANPAYRMQAKVAPEVTIIGQKYFKIFPSIPANICCAENLCEENAEPIIINCDGCQLHSAAFAAMNPQGIYHYSVHLLNLVEPTQDELSALENLRLLIEQTLKPLFAFFLNTESYVFYHAQRVAKLAMAIGTALKLGEEECRNLYLAGALIDIGQHAVPDAVLDSQVKLSNNEFTMIQSHPEVGFEILAGINFKGPIAKAVLQHHERLDAKGYPYGLRAEEICLEAKILGVADTVMAMTEDRPYRLAGTIEMALGTIKKEAKIKFDPLVVQACVEVLSPRD